MGKNGGSTIRVLEAGASGSPSTVLIDLELDFDITGYEKKTIAKDLAFVESEDGRTFFIMPSGTAHKVAIVDFNDGNNFATKYVQFSDAEFVNTAPHGRYRSVEWAIGTNYVWTNDSKENEQYVIDFVKAKLVKTVKVARSEMLSVQNWDQVRQASQQQKLMEDIKAMQEQVVADAMKEMKKNQQDEAAKAEEPKANQLSNSEGPEDSDNSQLLVMVAIGVAAVALLVGIVNLMYMNSMKAKMKEASYQSGASRVRGQQPKPLPIEKVDDPRDGDPLAVSA